MLRILRAVWAIGCAVACAQAHAAVTFRTTDFAPAPDSAFSIEGKAQMAVYRAFREKYPDLYPEANPLGLQFEGIAGEAPLLMSIAGGTAPDVIHVNTRQSGSFIEREFLHPLDDFIELEMTGAEAGEAGRFDPDIMYRDELEARVRPQVWDAVVREGPDGREHVYWLPFSHWVRVLAYNKTLFEEAGLDPDADYPKTWEGLLSTARRLHRPDEESYGMLVDSSGGASWVALPFFYSMGSEIVKKDPTSGEWHATFNDPGSIEAADFYLQLVDGPWKDPDSGQVRYGVGPTQDAWYLWDKGRIGMAMLYVNDMLINIDSHIAGLNPDEVGLVPVPASPAGTSITELHVRGLGICSTSTDPGKIAAAWKFIRFVGSPEAERAVVRTYVESGYGRFINPEKLRQHGYEEYLPAVPRQWADTLAYGLTHSRAEPYGKNCQVYILRASKPLEAAFGEDLARRPDQAVRLARLQELYDAAVADVNEKMLGRIPESVMAFRRRIALVTILLIAVGFVALFRYVWRLFTPEEQPTSGARKGLRKYALAYLLLAPAVLTIFVFSYYPLARGAIMAFQDYRVVGTSVFVGLDNFASILFDKIFWTSILHTVEFVLWSLVFVFASPIVLALLLSEIPFGKVFFRVVFYLPAVVSGLVVMLMWKMFYDPSPAGIFNQLLDLFGLEPQKWLLDRRLAMFSIILPLGWASMGPGCLIYLAALKTVPEDLYEAAAIDGAGILPRVRHITLPIIRPLMLIQLIFVLIASFQSADQMLVMTGGGPNNATHVVGLEIFYNAYVYLRFGTAIAIAWVLGFLLIGLTMIQMRRISRMSFTSAADTA